MTDAVIISLISAAGSVAAAAVSLLNHQLGQRNEAHIAETKTAITETKVAMVTLEKQTNSIKDALVKVTGQKAFAEGLKAGTEAAAAGKDG